MEFKGRLRRRSYYPIVFGIVFLAMIIKMGVASTATDVVPVKIISLFMLLCIIAVSVPRLHDAGYSGWYALLGLVPLISLIPVIMCMMPSEKKDNKWGKYER